MLDQAGIRMAQGDEIACERIAGVNDNMSQPHYQYFQNWVWILELMIRRLLCSGSILNGIAF